MRAFTVDVTDEVSLMDHVAILPYVEVMDYMQFDKPKTGLFLGDYYRRTDSGTDVSAYYFNLVAKPKTGGDFDHYVDYVNLSYVHDRFLVGEEADKYTSEDNDTAFVYIPSFDAETNLTMPDFDKLHADGSVIYGRTKGVNTFTHSYLVFANDGMSFAIEYTKGGKRHKQVLMFDDKTIKVIAYEISEVKQYSPPTKKSFSEYRRQRTQVTDTSAIQKYIKK